MNKLSKNWITEKHIDFEYKKYVLLAYLKEVGGQFGSNKLYPSLAEIIEHYKYLTVLKENKLNMVSSMPKRIHSFDLEKLEISYRKMLEDDVLMAEIESIVNYSIPKFEYYLQEGKKIYDFIEEHIQIHAVGVMPLFIDDGYMLLKGGSRATAVYQYHMTIYEQPDEKYRAIHTQFIRSYPGSFTTTYESIKTDLVRENKNLPNPAAYAIETDMALPLEETLLPIATRILVRHVARVNS